MTLKFYLCLVAALVGALLSVGVCRSDATSQSADVLVITGQVRDTTGNPISDAEVSVFLDGKPHAEDEEGPSSVHQSARNVTSGNGLFMIRVGAPAESIEKGAWALEVKRRNYITQDLILLKEIQRTDPNNRSAGYAAATVDVTLQRYQGPAFWLALIVLVGVYVLISLELVHRALAALLGAAAVLAITHTLGHFDQSYRILTFHQSLYAVDWNVIFLLMGMMIIVGVLKDSGIFQWMAYKSFELTGGRIFMLSAALCVVTAILSAFLDNVTTMLLLTPVTIEIALVLGISPFAFLIPEIMASNFGGTATLIGDPPNIMIGSYAGLTFNDFVITLTPVVVVTMIAQILYTKWYYGRDYDRAKVEDVTAMNSFLREKYKITDAKILWMGGAVLIGVVTLFILHGYFEMEVSVAALLGASLILVLTRVDPVKVLEHEIEWVSLVFFIMLFIVVGAAEETGILQFIADWLVIICQGNLLFAILLILWISAILSAIVDNIPFTATMLPVVAFLTKTIPGAENGVLWWALALGACFGGNGTIIGASANVITTGIAEKAGHKISFFAFLKHGAPITVISLLIASIFLVFVL
ncbi:SLC13 family permease [Thermodesulfobacteriota bacterium]